MNLILNSPSNHYLSNGNNMICSSQTFFFDQTPQAPHPHHVGIFQDHVVWVHFPAHAHYACNVCMAKLGKHLGLSAKLLLKLLVACLQALHQHHCLFFIILGQLHLGQEYLTKLPLPYRAGKNTSALQVQFVKPIPDLTLWLGFTQHGKWNQWHRVDMCCTIVNRTKCMEADIYSCNCCVNT